MTICPMTLCPRASSGCNYPEGECSGSCMTCADFRLNADITMPSSRSELIADCLLATAIGIALAAALVAWWSA